MADTCCFAYRLPGRGDECHYGCSDALRQGFHPGGFVIAPFLPDGEVYTIPESGAADSSRVFEVISKNFVADNGCSTKKDDYISEVEAFIDYLNNRGEGKIVASRRLRVDGNFDIEKIFHSLCRRYPNAFVFVFHSPESGTWFGATPELLLSRSGETLSTMALAGTRKAGTLGNWDAKNCEEQALVTDYISRRLSEMGCNPIVGQRFVKNAGPVEHLCTPITASLPSDSAFACNPCMVAKALSPTPAVCGSDIRESLRMIAEYEGYSREYYGGFCGPISTNSDFSFYVTLRCGQLFKDHTMLYAGGGITRFSKPDEEFTETENKFSTLLSSIQ